MTEAPGLSGVLITSGTTGAGKPFCTVEAQMDDGTVAMGQLSPEVVRMMALDFLAAAEAAESDAVTILIAKEIGVEDGPKRAALLLLQRSKREEARRLARGD